MVNSRWFGIGGAALLIGPLVSGCASARSEKTQQYVDTQQLAKPEVVLVYDFETGTPQT